MGIAWIILLTVGLFIQTLLFQDTGCISGKNSAPPVCGGVAVYAYWAVALILLYMILGLARVEYRKWKGKRKKEN